MEAWGGVVGMGRGPGYRGGLADIGEGDMNVWGGVLDVGGGIFGTQSGDIVGLCRGWGRIWGGGEVLDMWGGVLGTWGGSWASPIGLGAKQDPGIKMGRTQSGGHTQKGALWDPRPLGSLGLGGTRGGPGPPQYGEGGRGHSSTPISQ